MKVKAKETIPLGVRTIVKGTIIELPDGTASRLAREGRVEILARPGYAKKGVVPEDKAVKSAPENKEVKSVTGGFFSRMGFFGKLPEDLDNPSIERESVPQQVLTNIPHEEDEKALLDPPVTEPEPKEVHVTAEDETICPFCGEIKKTAGLGSHIRMKHPEQYESWKDES